MIMWRMLACKNALAGVFRDRRDLRLLINHHLGLTCDCEWRKWYTYPYVPH